MKFERDEISMTEKFPQLTNRIKTASDAFLNFGSWRVDSPLRSRAGAGINKAIRREGVC